MQRTGLCKCIDTVTSCCTSCRHGTCRNELPAASKRCDPYVDLGFSSPSCRQWGVIKQAVDFSEELRREGFVCVFMCGGFLVIIVLPFFLVVFCSVLWFC